MHLTLHLRVVVQAYLVMFLVDRPGDSIYRNQTLATPNTIYERHSRVIL